MDIIPYQTKSKKIPGTSRTEVYRGALNVFSEIKRKTKRRPYLRSAYFKKEKIFFDYFWDHLRQKSPKVRQERLQYFEAACDLIKNSRNKPIIKTNPNKQGETFYKFAGLISDKGIFFVQIKENKKRKRKYFMSCFPPG
jgi:hypothetical protein